MGGQEKRGTPGGGAGFGDSTPPPPRPHGARERGGGLSQAGQQRIFSGTQGPGRGRKDAPGRSPPDCPAPRKAWLPGPGARGGGEQPLRPTSAAPRPTLPHPGQQLQGPRVPPGPIGRQGQQLVTLQCHVQGRVPLLILGIDAAASVHQQRHEAHVGLLHRQVQCGLELPVADVHVTAALGRGKGGGWAQAPARDPPPSLGCVHTSRMRIWITSRWLLRAARCKAVKPSSFLASTS